MRTASLRAHPAGECGGDQPGGEFLTAPGMEFRQRRAEKTGMMQAEGPWVWGSGCRFRRIPRRLDQASLVQSVSVA